MSIDSNPLPSTVMQRLRAELDQALEDLTGARLSLWEEEQETARLRLALESAKRGRRELRARVAELEAGIAWRDAERDRWAEVVERAIDKGWSSIDTLDLECELGPEPTAPCIEYRYCGADLGRVEYPFTCERRIAHDGPCGPERDDVEDVTPQVRNLPGAGESR